MNAVIRNHERNETGAVDVLPNERADLGGAVTDSGNLHNSVIIG
jgi:hypothetical protein